MLGAGCAMQRWKAGMDGRHWRMSECWRHLHRMHHARVSRQVHAFYESAAGFSFVLGCGADLWTRDSRLAPLHPSVAEQRTELAQADTLVWSNNVFVFVAESNGRND